TLYALLFGGGASHGNPDTPNAIIRINTDRSITTIANLSKYLRAHPAAVPDPGDFEPDGTWYSMVHAGQNLYAVEPNHAELDRITLDGHVSRVLDFSAIIGSLTPTAMTVGPDGNFYIGNLTEIPYLDGLAHIFRVTPHGQISVAASGLTTVLGVAFDRQGRLYALETSTHNLGHPPFMQPGTGAVLRISASGGVQTIATGLTFPTAMTFGPDGNLYVSNFGYNGRPGQGQIVRISLSRRYCSAPARICPAP
ncbi:MAG: ScyD/ScyE family protein, partial [Chloroflexi bacterium]|nr:ScyD/ScyE family protein [Chloroflexota bacterium]